MGLGRVGIMSAYLWQRSWNRACQSRKIIKQEEEEEEEKEKKEVNSNGEY
jgi:hypothetical protein